MKISHFSFSRQIIPIKHLQNISSALRNFTSSGTFVCADLVSSWLSRVTLKGKKEKRPKAQPYPQTHRQYKMNAKWSLGSRNENEMGKRVGWWYRWLRQVWGTPVWQCPANTTLLLADVSWLMLGLSGVAGLATRLIHNPDKPSAVDWEATIADPALWQGGYINPCEFPDNVFCNFFKQRCIFWLYSDCWNSQMPGVIKTISTWPFIYLAS